MSRVVREIAVVGHPLPAQLGSSSHEYVIFVTANAQRREEKRG